LRKLILINHPDCDLHDHPGHPERSLRVKALLAYLQSSDLGEVSELLQSEPATREQLRLVHPDSHIDRIISDCERGVSYLDLDTYAKENTNNAATLSYGAALLAVDKVMSGDADAAFSVARPPGHHAGRSYSRGFCILNNIAGAARWAQKHHALERVAILDFDGHHGNGTQEIFYEDPTVHYTSIHQFPFYPGTGSARERGSGEGKGFNLNIELPAGARGTDAVAQLEEKWVEAMSTFEPQLLLCSAGFDAHRLDPLVMLSFADEDFDHITKLITEIAGRHCQGKVVSLLEGGYDLEALNRCVYIHLKGLIDG
jgi:acetoin utilization deacetylase AcuC-like enzyme